MFSRKTQIAFLAVGLCFMSVSATADDFNPFASEVIDISLNSPDFPTHCPAPGQWIHHPNFKNPDNALGAPDGVTSLPAVLSVVSLGGFGGQIVLAFDHDVEDNPANPMGLDAIVFSNAFLAENNAQWHWAEFATIEIMPELNGNNTPGDDPNEKWYLIAGSHLFDPNSYRITSWSRSDFPLPDELLMHYPNYTSWPDYYETGAHELEPDFQVINGQIVLVNPNYDDEDPNNDSQEGYWGYAEYMPTVLIGDRDANNNNEEEGDVNDMLPELFYTNPDDPMTVGITAGSGGGDAFDIAWAVDESTWLPATLNSFRYIRITTAVDLYFDDDLYGLGEISAEIDAVADVRPMGDIDGDNDVDFTDLYLFTKSWLAEWPDFNPAADLVVDNKVDFADYALFALGWSQYNSQ
jgi:hypothetical protein